jgi:N-acetyl-D-muramate 6-phosphate phosphatase
MPLKVPMIKALCFDVDGTLSDTDDLYTRQLSKFFPKLIFKNPNYTALLGLADSLHLDDEMVAVINWLSRHRKHSDKKFLLVPGVDEMLKQLHGRYPMAVVSARDEKGTMRFLEQFDLVKYFDTVITGLSATHTKPYPDPVLLAAKNMNVPPENCLMIGDTTVDIRAGRAAGAQTVGVLCGFGEEPELRKMGADEIISDTPKLLDLLRA